MHERTTAVASRGETAAASVTGPIRRSLTPGIIRSKEQAALAVTAIIAHRAGKTNGVLVDAWRALGIDARLVAPDAAVEALGPGDVALLRIDVSAALDGFESGLERVPDLRFHGVRILNAPWALIGAHDKLETARRLREAQIPHPRTAHILRADSDLDISLPVVVKPRHGSWGRDVYCCRTEADLRSCLRAVQRRDWFSRQGALVQELIEPSGRDFRLIVAGGQVVGAAAREARPGEWRTNVSLGGRAFAVAPDEEATRLALTAVAAVGGDLVGVDLIPLADGGYTVLELNGAVDFDDRYSLPGTSVFTTAARALHLPRSLMREARWRAPRHVTDAGVQRSSDRVSPTTSLT
jgi:RimK family alpha-L-glutamate ligase